MWGCYRLYRQSAAHRIIQCRSVLGSCVGTLDVWSSDPGSANLILKVEHYRLNLICCSLFQLYRVNLQISVHVFIGSGTADRSFFSNWRRADRNLNLRSTCGQRRLNIIAMSRVIDIIDVHELMKEFVLLRGSRTLRSDRFSFKTTVCVWWNWFLQCFWLLFSHFEVCSCTAHGQMPKSGGTKIGVWRPAASQTNLLT